MNTTVLNVIRTAKGFSRGVIYLVIVAVVGVVLERVIYYTLRKADVIEAETPIERLYRVAPYKARQLSLPKQVAPQSKEQTNDTKLSEAVIATQDTLDVLAYELHRDGGDPVQAQARLDALYTQLQQQDRQAMADFREIGRHIDQHKLPDVIKQRHDKAVFNYRKDMDSLLGELRAAIETQDPDAKLEAVMAARKQLEGKQLKRSNQPFDPNNLPNKSLQPPKDNPPKLKEEQFIQAGLHNSPYTQYAALGDFTYGNLPGASNPAYLAETTEVKITQAIRTQAQALNYDPVQIYHWVRNNIVWLPTWGAMQDADITLGSKRGNAMDIASLLIALLRASQIPARYAHGTIEVPADKFMNWVGPFTNINAAQSFAASGGIPMVGVVSGGQVKAIRMEHIWVESAVDYHPSRGARNIDADSWIALDASYKQYEDQVGLDVENVTNIDGQALANNLVGSGTVNEAEGWVSGYDQSILTNTAAQTQTELENYINSNMPNAALGDVLGGRGILVHQADSLPSSLPNNVLVSGPRYSEIPNALQAKLTLVLGRDIIGEPIGQVVLPWSQVNNHKLTLSFKPESAEDVQVLQSYLPAGTSTDITELPANIPAYLINVIPEVKLDGQVVSQGLSVSLGQEINLDYSLSIPGINMGGARSIIQAGSYVSLAMFGGSISKLRLTELQNKVASTQSILESGDVTLIKNLTREDLLGDMFHSGMLGYYAQLLGWSHVTGLKQKASQNILLTGGTYGYMPKVSYFFGLPRAIQPGGIIMDLNRTVTVTSAWDGDNVTEFNMTQQVGMIGSALEHVVPERMFVTQENPGEAVSAVKLLARATQAGQRIYHITKDNYSTALPNLNLNSDVINDINAALNAGKEVITHTQDLNISGYTGTGYIVFDPEKGDGAYLISGGFNGGGLFTAIGYLLNTISIFVGLLEAIATKLGSIIPGLQSIVRFVEVAKFTYSLLEKGAHCDNFAAIAIFMTLVAIATILTIALISAANPILAFGLGLGADLFFDWMINQSPDCR